MGYREDLYFKKPNYCHNIIINHRIISHYMYDNTLQANTTEHR